MIKLFFFHIPKTAGTSVNTFFEKNVSKSASHIEGLKYIDSSFLYTYDFISGHVSFSDISNIINLRDWCSIIILRDPYEHVISHLSWVRLLAEPDQQESFSQHPLIFQTIAKKMTCYDFSSPFDISCFINWLDDIGFNYFHNTQTLYLSLDKCLDKSIFNLNKINYVGISDEVDLFLKILSNNLCYDTKLFESPRENYNSNKFGFDVNNQDIRDALYPLVKNDIILYNEAMSIFNQLKIEHFRSPSSTLDGWVDYVSSNNIKGWVFDKYCSRFVEVGLYLDGTLFSTSIANKYRPGLLKRGINKTGMAEFVFNLSIDMSKYKTFLIKDMVTGKVIPLLPECESFLVGDIGYPLYAEN